MFQWEQMIISCYCVRIGYVYIHLRCPSMFESSDMRMNMVDQAGCYVTRRKKEDQNKILVTFVIVTAMYWKYKEKMKWRIVIKLYIVYNEYSFQNYNYYLAIFLTIMLLLSLLKYST